MQAKKNKQAINEAKIKTNKSVVKSLCFNRGSNSANGLNECGWTESGLRVDSMGHNQWKKQIVSNKIKKCYLLLLVVHYTYHGRITEMAGDLPSRDNDCQYEKRSRISF